MQYFFSHIVWKKKISLKYSLDSSRTDPDPKWKFYLKDLKKFTPKNFSSSSWCYSTTNNRELIGVQVFSSLSPPFTSECAAAFKMNKTCTIHWVSELLHDVISYQGVTILQKPAIIPWGPIPNTTKSDWSGHTVL